MIKNYFTLSDYEETEDQERDLKTAEPDLEELSKSRPRFPTYVPEIKEVQVEPVEKKQSIEELTEELDKLELTDERRQEIESLIKEAEDAVKDVPDSKFRKYPSIKPEEYLGRIKPRKQERHINVSFSIEETELVGLVYALKIAKNVADFFEEIVRGNTTTVDILDVGNIEEIVEEVENLAEQNGYDL